MGKLGPDPRYLPWTRFAGKPPELLHYIQPKSCKERPTRRWASAELEPKLGPVSEFTKLPSRLGVRLSSVVASISPAHGFLEVIRVARYEDGLRVLAPNPSQPGKWEKPKANSISRCTMRSTRKPAVAHSARTAIHVGPHLLARGHAAATSSRQGFHPGQTITKTELVQNEGAFTPVLRELFRSGRCAKQHPQFLGRQSDTLHWHRISRRVPLKKQLGKHAPGDTESTTARRFKLCSFLVHPPQIISANPQRRALLCHGLHHRSLCELWQESTGQRFCWADLKPLPSNRPLAPMVE